MDNDNQINNHPHWKQAPTEKPTTPIFENFAAFCWQTKTLVLAGKHKKIVGFHSEPILENRFTQLIELSHKIKPSRSGRAFAIQNNHVEVASLVFFHHFDTCSNY